MRVVIAVHAKLSAFEFFPPDHSVARAEYQQPCIPYEDTWEDKVGYWSGFFPLDKILPNASDSPCDHMPLLNPVNSRRHGI